MSYGIASRSRGRQESTISCLFCPTENFLPFSPSPAPSGAFLVLQAPCTACMFQGTAIAKTLEGALDSPVELTLST